MVNSEVTLIKEKKSSFIVQASDLFIDLDKVNTMQSERHYTVERVEKQ